jgi:hypothetical protein
MVRPVRVPPSGDGEHRGSFAKTSASPSSRHEGLKDEGHGLTHTYVGIRPTVSAPSVPELSHGSRRCVLIADSTTSSAVDSERAGVLEAADLVHGGVQCELQVSSTHRIPQ